jgi:hypothetical protein
MNKQSINLPGQSGEWETYVSKYQPDSSKVLDNMFTVGSKNFVTDQTGMIQKRQGGVQWNRTSFGQPANDTYEAVFESGSRHFLRVGGGTLSASTGTGLFDTITSGYSTLGNFEWVTYQNRSYGCNGVNAPQVYDTAISYGGVSYSFTTAKTKVMGAQAPVTAPTAGAPTAGGAIPVGAHRYKVTFMYYESEESNGSAASAVQTTTSGNQTIPLTNIPIGGYGVTARNIYRDNNDGVYKLLDTIPNNTATTYTDTLLIGGTPTNIPTTNDVPPTFNKIALWLDSVFIAPTGETNVIRFSNSGAPDIFDPENFITCQSDDVVTGLYVYNGKLYVFGLHSVGSIEGNTPDTFFYHNVSPLIGCVDNRSIQVRSIVSVPTLWWLSDKGMYYSNGNTVEYGSDFIQDLVNLNLAQVNYTVNKNTQTSFADFSGDTRTPGIDIDTIPGEIMTVNPIQEYNTTADWLGGSSKVNVKTSNGNFIEAATRFAPSLGSGQVNGDVSISGGTSITVPSSNPFSGAGNSFTGNFVHWGNNANDGGKGAVAIPFRADRDGTLNSFTTTWNSGSGGIQVGMYIYSDNGGNPGSQLAVSPTTYTGGSLGGASFAFSLSLTAGTIYWAIINVNNRSFGNIISDTRIGSSNQNLHPNGLHTKFQVISHSENWTGHPWGDYADYMYGAFAFTYTPVAKSGSWTSPVYDSGSLTALPTNLSLTGSYGATATGSVVIYASPNANMSGYVSQTISTPNGTYAVTLSNYRYWQIVQNISVTDNINGVSQGTPLMLFNTTATWISQPIDTTTDNTSWDSLTYTGNIPLGTSVALTIATSTNNISYTSFGPIGSALIQRWAKVQLVLTTDGGNTTSPSISSVTLTWNISATITSNGIDTGTDPAGFNTFQWENPNPGVGTITFSLRTATTLIGLASASYVTVANGNFPNLTALRFVQWKAVLTASSNNVPEITSVTVSWFTSTGQAGVRCASIFYNKTYYLAVATVGSTYNNLILQLDQFGKWRIQKDTSVGTFLSYFNTLYFTDGISGLIFNGFIANTDNGAAIEMDVRTKAWNAGNDLFLKVPRALKITGIHTGTTIRAYYSPDRGTTWYEMLNEAGTTGFVTNVSGDEFIVLFVPDGTTLNSGRTLIYRIVSSDVYPCSIINFVPSFYSRKGRYLSNG